MALRGNLRDFSLPDVFQLVTLSGKTGVLRIRRSDAEGSVWFRDGAVFFAQSDWHHEVLGQRLVTAGKITPSALAKALEIQKTEPEGGRRLGQILVDEGYVTDNVLEAFVQEQIQDTIFDLFRWDEGDFDFETLDSVPEEDIGLSVSIENVVMEGSRRLEEWTRIKKKIPSMGIVFKMATAPGEGTFDISLKPTEWSLLLKVDGTRSVADLARDMARTDFEVARIIYGLFSAGLLEVASDEEVDRLRAERDKLEASIAAAQPVAPVAAPEPEAPATVPAAESPAAAPEPVVDEPAFLSAGQPAGGSDDMGTLQEMMGAVLEAPAAQAPTPEAAPPGAEAEAVAPAIEEPLTAAPAVEVAAPPVETPEPPVEAAEPPVETPAPAEAPLATGVYVFEEAQPLAPTEPPLLEVEAAMEPEPEAEPEPPDAQAVAADGASELQGLLETLETVRGMPADAAGGGYIPTVAEPASVAAPRAGAEAVPSGDYAADLMALGLGELPTAEPSAAEAQELTIAEIEAAARAAEDGGATIAEIEAAARAADSEEATIAEIEAAARLAMSGSATVETDAAAAQEASDLTDLLTSLGGPDDVLGASAAATLEGGPEPGAEGTGAPAAGVISTDAFLSDFGNSDVSFSTGLGDEITALTGGGGGRQRPNVNVAKLPDGAQEGQVLHRDSHVDRDLLLRIIEGVQHL